MNGRQRCKIEETRKKISDMCFARDFRHIICYYPKYSNHCVEILNKVIYGIFTPFDDTC